MTLFAFTALLAACDKPAPDPRSSERIEELTVDVYQLKADVRQLQDDVKFNHKYARETQKQVSER